MPADEPTGNLRMQPEEIMRRLRDLDRPGTPNVRVTRLEANAAEGNRMARLRNGWLETP